MPSQSIRPIRVCPHCATEFTRKPSDRSRYCSSACFGASIPSTPAEPRFWSFVCKTDTCWLWTGAKLKTGYGQFARLSGETRVHRISYTLLVGPIPPGLDLCHNCPGGDNRLCVNPAHLFPGTRKENMQDALRKGRHSRHLHPDSSPKGEASTLAKLTDEQVIEIRSRYAVGNVTQRALASDYGVTHTLIGYIVRREHWKHI